MLVLSRKTDERVLVGGCITVTVLRVGKNEVRLGIDAPPDINIRRSELVTAGTTGSEAKEADANQPTHGTSPSSRTPR
jgi:carbon storage regulator